MKLFTKSVEKAIAKFPLYSQDGKGMNAKVIARFFLGNATWYILEGNGDELYGLTDVGHGFEYGYMSRKQLETLKNGWGLGVERDITVDPLKMTLGECMTLNGERMM